LIYVNIVGLYSMVGCRQPCATG